MIWCWEAIGRFLCVHLYKHNQHLSNVWSSYGNQWRQIGNECQEEKGQESWGAATVKGQGEEEEEDESHGEKFQKEDRTRGIRV